MTTTAHDPRSPVPSRAAEAGFTLVEALVAMVILVVGLLAVSNLLVVAVSSNAVANRSTAATVVASTVLERLKAVPFLTLVGGIPAPGAVGSLTTDMPATNNVPCANMTAAQLSANFNCIQPVPGVSQIKVRWTVSRPGAGGPDTIFIRVRAESLDRITAARSRAQFTMFRTCTVTGCP